LSEQNPVGSIRPILSVRHDNGERLIVARLTNAGTNSQSNRFALRTPELRSPWLQPENGYFGYAEVARALVANGWRGCAVEALPTADAEEARARRLAVRKLHAPLIAASIERARFDR
jgi:hypothetical protein